MLLGSEREEERDIYRSIYLSVYTYIYRLFIQVYVKTASWFAGKKFRNQVININLNVLKYLGYTCLHYASEKGHLSVVELLLDRGANIDQKNKFGEFIIFKYLSMYLSNN